jgi:hypothetical protein
MAKVIIHQFDPVIYPFKLWVSITDDLTAISERFIDHKSGKELNTDNLDKTIAFTQNVEQKSDRLIGAIIVFGRKGYCSTKIIAHEATHAARMLWDHVGEDATGMEADAYLVGWIADCIEKVKLNKF